MIQSRMNGNLEKAIIYDRKLLEIIDQLQQMYVKKNRKFRNYDTSKYISYRRMMSNYPALTDEEIESIHDSIVMLYNRDADVKKAMDNHGEAFAFYYMATKQYEKAVPALKGMLEDKDLSSYNKQKYNAMLIEASKAINDQKTYIESMERFIVHSNEIDSMRKITMRREIMLRDSIINAPLLYNSSKQEEKRLTNREHIKIEQTLTIIASALAILLIIYVILYIRLRRKLVRK